MGVSSNSNNLKLVDRSTISQTSFVDQATETDIKLTSSPTNDRTKLPVDFPVSRGTMSKPEMTDRGSQTRFNKFEPWSTRSIWIPMLQRGAKLQGNSGFFSLNLNSIFVPFTTGQYTGSLHSTSNHRKRNTTKSSQSTPLLQDRHQEPFVRPRSCPVTNNVKHRKG